MRQNIIKTKNLGQRKISLNTVNSQLICRQILPKFDQFFIEGTIKPFIS